MAVLLIIVIGFTLTVSAVIVTSLIRNGVRTYLKRSKHNKVVSHTEPVNIDKFNCRSVLVNDENVQDADDTAESFKLEICGAIHAPSDQHQTTSKVFVSDITDGVYKAISIRSSVEKWQMKNTQIFCYQADLGTLPNAETVLPDWMTIAKFPCDTLVLPRKGTRVLQFRTSIFSNRTNEEISHAAFELLYENPDQGYLDIEEEIYHANSLGTSLAFAFAASGGRKIPQRVVNVIKKWAKENLDRKHEPGKAAIKTQRILSRILGRFHLIEKIRTTEICGHINDTAPLAIKCNILLLCLNVISTSQEITTRQTSMLKDTARLLNIETERLRAMIEDIRPFAMYEINDVEISLGITSEMDEKQVRKQLSNEYRKWNSRVINTSAEIRDEAANMLELIGETKEELCV